MPNSIGFDPKAFETLDRGFRIWNEQMVTAISGVIEACGGIAPNLARDTERIRQLLAAIDTDSASIVNAQTSERERRWQVARAVFVKAKGQGNHIDGIDKMVSGVNIHAE